jgi:hypothetical protein
VFGVHKEIEMDIQIVLKVILRVRKKNTFTQSEFLFFPRTIIKAEKVLVVFLYDVFILAIKKMAIAMLKERLLS